MSRHTMTQLSAKEGPYRSIASPRPKFATVAFNFHEDDVNHLPRRYASPAISLSPRPHGSHHLKRRHVPECSMDEEEPEAKKMREVLYSHPIYEENAPKVTLVSSDGQRFCVDRRTLSTYSSEFERIITLLAPESVSADGTESLVLEETAEELSRMLHGLYAARHAPSILPQPTLEMLYANVKLHKKYKIEITRAEAYDELHQMLKQDPFAGLAYASHQNDLDLGRQAIRLIQFDTDMEHHFDLWKKMADIKHSWQLALASLLLRVYAYQNPPYEYPLRRAITLEVNCDIDLDQVALAFDPKWVESAPNTM